MALPRHWPAWRELLFGRALTSEEQERQQIGVATGVPFLGLDALASASYGPEAALTVFVLAGASGLPHVLPIIGAIVAVLLIVQFSYRQTIATHPGGGGSYTVAKENLGRLPGLLAASALFLDYLLNVAVAISAGVGALVSAVPRLQPYTLPLCLALLAGLTLINLRGIRAAGIAFALPTLAFVALLGGTLLFGLSRLALGAPPVSAAVPPPPAHHLAATAGPWLVLRAFASGCTAMTGIEAVSNAVPIFREPRIRTAQRTLSTIVVVLVGLLIGIALLARALDVTATVPGEPGYQSILSQVVGAVVGRGSLYYLTMASVILVLCLSANTSFADFPRLCRVLALDEYLPEGFAHQGRRLVYSAGIVMLAIFAALLLVIFGGVTDHLIPLFAIGALAAFTLSQAGMVAYWKRRPGHRRSLAVNAVGAVTTGVTLVIVAVSKFVAGAWISIAFIGLALATFLWMHRHFANERRQVAAHGPMQFTPQPPPIVVVPLRGLGLVTRKELRFAMSLSPEVYVVQVRALTVPVDDLSASWEPLVAEPARRAGLTPPKLVVLQSEFREVVDPLLRFVRQVSRENPRRRVMVIVPEVVERRWYHYLLHSHTATEIRLMLMFRGGPQVVLVNVPWYLTDAPTEPERAPPRDARPP